MVGSAAPIDSAVGVHPEAVAAERQGYRGLTLGVGKSGITGIGITNKCHGVHPDNRLRCAIENRHHYRNSRGDTGGNTAGDGAMVGLAAPEFSAILEGLEPVAAGGER